MLTLDNVRGQAGRFELESLKLQISSCIFQTNAGIVPLKAKAGLSIPLPPTTPACHAGRRERASVNKLLGGCM